jgi:acetylornithine deacetylase
VGDDPARIRARFEEAVHRVSPETTIGWTGGAFHPGETSPEHPFSRLVLAATGDELGRPARAVGVPYGADMRLFCARGIPCVMVGTSGLDQAHAVDESVEADELARLARIIVRVITRFAGAIA